MGAEMELETTTQTYMVFEWNLDHLKEQIATLNKRARRLHVPEITITTGDPVDEEKGERVIRRIPVTITGTAPKLAGWTLIAVLQHMDEGFVLLRAVPGYDVPERYREASPDDCDHCQKKIRTRKETFIVLHEDGRYRQVGRNCLRDFLGHVDPHGLASLAEILATAGAVADACCDESYGGGGEPLRWRLDGFLTAAAASIRMRGWTSRKQERDDPTGRTQSTADATLYDLTCKHRGRCSHPEITQADREEARLAREWADSLVDRDGNSDYEHNVSVLAQIGSIEWKTAGIAASIVSVAQRNRAREAERKYLAATRTHVGTVGKRQIFTLTLVDRKYFESQWGVTVFHRFSDHDGNILIWMASTDPQISVGSVYRVKATVKAHDDYHGVPQTKITRAVILDSEKVAA